jgi:hypothetical protein
MRFILNDKAQHAPYGGSSSINTQNFNERIGWAEVSGFRLNFSPDAGKQL